MSSAILELSNIICPHNLARESVLWSPGASTVVVAPDMVRPIKYRDLGAEVRGSMEPSHAADELVERDGRATVSKDAMATF